MFKKSIIALALLGAAATAQSAVLLNQNFNSDITTLAGAGYVMTNASTPVGLHGFGWGDPTQFAAQSGAAHTYLSGDYNNAAAGGTIQNFFITPVFSTATDVVVSFWARGMADPNYLDHLAFGFSNGSAAVGSFSMGSVETMNGEWTKYTATISSQGAGSIGRFAIEYVGDADTSNFVGIDTLSVTQVPEPASLLIVGTGLFGLMAARRRKQR